MKNLLLIIFIAILFSGCSVKSALYKPDFNSINELKTLNIKPMAIQRGNSQNQAVNEISLRASKMFSPYGENFEEYLKVSLEEHLKSANLFDKNSNLLVTSTLLKNEVETGLAATGTADISANFTLNKDGQLIYDKTLTIHHEWDSSFVGAIAIPNATENYPIAIQKLINKLMADDDFLRAIRK
ncbi:MAG: hypothetical protein Q7T77_07530 [Sulfuricurvum sp.]|nr:hypothetical protein [Sulfuricurvum sp.]